MTTSKYLNWLVDNITLDRDNPFDHPFVKAELVTTTFPKTPRLDELHADLQNRLNGMNLPEIKNVIFNPPATIVFWADDTKTVVKCQEGDTYNPETGLAMAIVKRMYGNTGKYCEIFKKWITFDYIEIDYPGITIDPKFLKNNPFTDAVEKIKKAANASTFSVGEALAEYAKKEADRTLAEKLEKETGWISTKDRMPTKDGDYLVYDTYTHSIYVYEFQYHFYDNADEKYWNNYITHWMPVPKAPVTKKGV